MYKFVMVIILWLGFQTPVKGQVCFDYITDWSNIFLSNINQVSPFSNANSSRLSRSLVQNIHITSTLTYNDFYREKFADLERNLSNFQQRNTLQTSLKLDNRVIDIGAEFYISQKELNYDLTESQSFHIRNRFKEYQVSLGTTLFTEYLRVRGTLGRKIMDRKEFYPWNFGVTFQPAKSLLLTYQRFEDFFRWEYNFRFENPAIILLADEYTQLDEFQIRLNLLSELTLSATMQNNYINKDRTVDLPGTILIPFGTQYQRNIVLYFFPENQFYVNLGFYSRSHDLAGYFFDSFQKFGKITEQNDHSELYQSEFLIRMNSQSVGFNFGWSEGTMTNNGYVESWPFTPTWIDLLGVRYNFKSQLMYNLFRIGVSYQYLTSDWQIYFNTSFERIIPEGEAKTWEPEVLVFGIQNLKVNTFLSKPRNGVYVGLHLSKSFGKIFELAYEIQQYIPLEFNRGGGLKNDDVLKKSVYGGGKHSLNLICNLD